MTTIKGFRSLLLVYLAVSLINTTYGLWRGSAPSHILSPAQTKALVAMAGPGMKIGLATALSLVTLGLEIWGWVGLFLLRASGRTCFTASSILAFVALPLFTAWTTPASYSALIGAGVIRLPGGLEVLFGNLSSVLSGALLAVIYSDEGSRLFRR